METLVYSKLWKRGAAFVIDAFILALMTWGLVNLIFSDSVRLTLVYASFIYLFIPFLYFSFLEAIYAKTLGKKVLGIKVVKQDGEEAYLVDTAIRNILRFVDVLPFFYVVGAISIWRTEKKQRIGDLAAKTVVVDDVFPVE